MAQEIERVLTSAATAVIGGHEPGPPQVQPLPVTVTPAEDSLLLIRQELTLIAQIANEMLRLAWLMEPLRLPRSA